MHARGTSNWMLATNCPESLCGVEAMVQFRASGARTAEDNCKRRWTGERIFRSGDRYSRGVARGGKAALADGFGSDGVRYRGCRDAGGGCAERSEVGGSRTGGGD